MAARPLTTRVVDSSRPEGSFVHVGLSGTKVGDSVTRTIEKAPVRLRDERGP